MVAIESDNAEIGRCLERMLAQARRTGAEFTDDLIIRCRHGSLSLALPPDSTADTIIKLPERALIPIRSFRLSLDGDHIVIDGADADVPAERRTLLEYMIELYNLTSKIAWYRRTAVPLVLRVHSDLAAVVARGCDSPMRRLLTDQISADAMERVLLDRFLGTRLLDYREDQSEAGQDVLMPIVDFMNHHANGAAFQIRSGELKDGLRVGRAKGIPGDQWECLATYGQYDAMETLLRYNFPDDSNSFVRSIPVVITLPEVGTISADAARTKGAGKNLPPALKPIGRYLPKILNKQPRYLKVAFLAISPAAPHALRQVLNLLIANLDRAKVDRLDLILAAEAQVMEANKAHYREIQQVLKAVPPAGADESQVLADLSRACDLQLERLQSYEDRIRSLAA